MYACFVLYVYIIQAHRTRYMSHPSHIAIQICPGIQNNIKIKTIGLPFKNNPRQRKKNPKKKTCPNLTPSEVRLSTNISSSCIQLVTEVVSMSVYTRASCLVCGKLEV